MAFEEIKASVALLFADAQRTPEDWHEVSEQVRQQLVELRGMGLPVPADLVDLETALEEEMRKRTLPA